MLSLQVGMGQVLFCFLFCFKDRVSLCSLGCLGIYSVDQAGLEHSDLPASASQVLGLKTRIITSQLLLVIFCFLFCFFKMGFLRTALAVLELSFMGQLLNHSNGKQTKTPGFQSPLAMR